jgi:hypothetical protein
MLATSFHLGTQREDAPGKSIGGSRTRYIDCLEIFTAKCTTGRTQDRQIDSSIYISIGTYANKTSRPWPGIPEKAVAIHRRAVRSAVWKIYEKWSFI